MHVICYLFISLVGTFIFVVSLFEVVGREFFLQLNHIWKIKNAQKLIFGVAEVGLGLQTLGLYLDYVVNDARLIYVVERTKIQFFSSKHH